MEINIRDDCVEITGYVNSVERNSKPLLSRIGKFIERVCKGAFTKALERNDNVKLLLNHDPERQLGSTKEGNLELHEDAIGLHARATIRDCDVIEKARRGELVGWSFGFYDTPDGVEQGIDEESRLPLRKLRDLMLEEVSILDKTKTPAYDGTLVAVRSDDTAIYYSDILTDEPEIREEKVESAESNEIDYSQFEKIIKDMKGEE